MKNRLIQIALSAALVGVMVQVVLIAPSRIRDAESKAAVQPAPDLSPEALQKDTANNNSDVDQSIKGMHMIETQEGRKEWEISSDRAKSLKAKDLLELEVVKTIFFSDSGVTFDVTGEKGEIQMKTKNLSVEGDVVTRTSNGYVFRTESMEYESKVRQLRAQNHVEMFGPKDSQGHSFHLTGVGMKASLEKDVMEVLSDVRAEKEIDGSRTVYIKSERSVFSSKDKTAKFMDDVVIDVDSMRITGPEAVFDYDSKRDLIKSVVVSGGSRVSDPDKWATAKTVSIDFDTNEYVFRGDPRLVQNNDQLRGEEIVFLDGGKQVQVRGARAKMDERRLDQKKTEKVN